MRAHRRAFTIVEILVVISMISVLAAITVPAYFAARKTAERTATRMVLIRVAHHIMEFEEDTGFVPFNLPLDLADYADRSDPTSVVLALQNYVKATFRVPRIDLRAFDYASLGANNAVPLWMRWHFGQDWDTENVRIISPSRTVFHLGHYGPDREWGTDDDVVVTYDTLNRHHVDIPEDTLQPLFSEE